MPPGTIRTNDCDGDEPIPFIAQRVFHVEDLRPLPAGLVAPQPPTCAQCNVGTNTDTTLTCRTACGRLCLCIGVVWRVLVQLVRWTFCGIALLMNGCALLAIIMFMIVAMLGLEEPLGRPEMLPRVAGNCSAFNPAMTTAVTVTATVTATVTVTATATATAPPTVLIDSENNLSFRAAVPSVKPMVAAPPPQSMVAAPPPQSMVAAPPPQSMVAAPPPQSMVAAPPPQSMVAAPPPQSMVAAPPPQSMVAAPPPYSHTFVGRPTDTVYRVPRSTQRNEHSCDSLIPRFALILVGTTCPASALDLCLEIPDHCFKQCFQHYVEPILDLPPHRF